MLALPLFAIAIGCEVAHSKRTAIQRYDWPDSLASLAMLLASAIVDLIPKLLAIGAMVYLHDISPLRDVVAQQWWAWMLLFLLEDLSYYWFHRANHSVRLFWAGHVNHHSSRYLNLGTALRQGVGERFHKYLFWLWLPLLGFDPAMIVTLLALSLIYQFWIHTEVVGRLPAWVEWLFNTPSHHRVHHASNIRYLDCNHGGVLIIWDRLFGTFAKEQVDEPCEYGLTQNIDSHHPWVVLTHGYRALWRVVRAAGSPRAALGYLLLAPGWSHNGPDRRARVLRASGDRVDPVG